MKEEQRARVVFRDFVPERELYTSRGLTKEEYIIKRFEEATGNKFDPDKYEIVEENNAFDDAFDNPVSTYVVIRKKTIIIGDPPITPIPPRGPGEDEGPGIEEPGGIGGPTGPGRNDGPNGPGGTRGPIIGGIPGGKGPGNKGPEKPEGPEKPGKPEQPDGPERQGGPENPGKPEKPGKQDKPTGPGESNEPGGTRGPSGKEPEKPNKPEQPRGPSGEPNPPKGPNEPGKPVPTPQVPEYIKKDPVPGKPVPTPQVPEEIKNNPLPPEKGTPEKPEGKPVPPEKPEKQDEPIPPKGPEGQDEPVPPKGPETEDKPIPPKKPGDEKPPIGIPPRGPVPTPQVPGNVPKEPTPDEIEKQRLVQDMLDKYYGNPKKRKEYKERYKRFKSHIIQKAFQYVTEQGVLTTGTCYTVDTTYPEYAEDAQFLQLREYASRLERASRADVGDKSAYIAVVNDYLHKKAALGERVEESFEELVEMLIEDDREYLLTNNYAYNTHRATRENLNTLGKHGENVSYIPLSQEKSVKQKALNIIRRGMNIAIFLRDHVTAPIHRGIGKYIIKPIHEMIFDVDNQPSGMYRGKRTHRYVARKEYYAVRW